MIDFTIEQYYSHLEHIRKRARKTILYNCMCPLCKKKPIFSHVFQKKGILSQIANKGKVFMFTTKHLFAIHENNSFVEYRPIGINEAFGFMGFCLEHDNGLFSPIEPSKGVVDWYDKKSQYLLAYRSVCREISVNYEVIFMINERMKFLAGDENSLFAQLFLKTNCNNTIAVLQKYKIMLENGIFKMDFSTYEFKAVELPFVLDLCVSAPIIIKEETAGLYFGPPKENIDNVVNIINIFPYKTKTIVLMGFLCGKPNKWMGTIYDKISSNRVNNISKALQDILFRAEFHCISEKLYNSLFSEIPQFLKEWSVNADNFSASMEYKSNIFCKYLTQIYTENISQLCLQNEERNL